jgi:hypothetical protein
MISRGDVCIVKKDLPHVKKGAVVHVDSYGTNGINCIVNDDPLTFAIIQSQDLEVIE